MSKPEDIPQDVWDAAGTVWYFGLNMANDRFGGVEIIARAIHTERVACAHAGFDAARAARCGLLRARQIDSAIRKRGEG